MRELGVATVAVDGEQTSALSLYRQSLGLRRAIVMEFGRTPQALSDVAVSLDSLTDTLSALGVATLEIDGEQTSALSLCRESRDIRRAILKEFGRSPETLRDLLFAHSSLARVANEHADREAACAELRHCEEVLAEIEQLGWTDAQSIQDRAWLDATKQAWQCR